MYDSRVGGVEELELCCHNGCIYTVSIRVSPI